MTPRVLRHADRVPAPWANGGGVTREVARSGPGPGFDWRVSVADVDRPGPFSTLPGVDRIIVLLDGTGLVLSVGGTDRVLEPLQPFAFSGDVPTTCTLRAGPTRDLNVMTARGRWEAAVDVVAVAGRLEVTPAGGEDLLLVAAGGGLVCGGLVCADLVCAGATPVGLDRLDAVAGPAVLDGDGTVIVVRLRRSLP